MSNIALILFARGVITQLNLYNHNHNFLRNQKQRQLLKVDPSKLELL